MGGRNAVAVDSRACLELGSVRRLGPYAPTAAGGVEAAAFSPDADPAVVTYNDLLAIGLMRGLAVRESVSRMTSASWLRQHLQLRFLHAPP